jgi:putative FmdB family regulatory protein
MPIYEYECRKCGHRFEFFVLPSSPIARCPSCHKTDLEQLISLSAVSSESQRHDHLKAARKKNRAIHKQKEHEEFKQEEHKHDDH